MKRWIMEYICCPVCQGELHLQEAAGDETEVLTGVLTCAKCNRTYPITDGIPDLLAENQR